ncbi:hypothetical protein V5E97_06890 [Singulisphaera sp. Ch08]|uniref:Uncharacterized protein n=1 Tax=Singulisphaera sp. Ch08 TaxID=3120278 RepID=A0AAU7CKR6_9BACT
MATLTAPAKTVKTRRSAVRPAKYLATKVIWSLTSDSPCVDYSNEPMTLGDVLGEIGTYWTEEDGQFASGIIEEANDYNGLVYAYREILTITRLDGSELSADRLTKIGLLAGL